MKEIIIPGKPIPLQRHRVFRGCHYDPQAKVKRDLIYSIKDQLEGIKISSGPLIVEAEFHFAWPKKVSKKLQRERKFSAWRPIKPDIDNLLKIWDVFNGILWYDDSQIVSVSASKVNSETSMTIFRWIDLSENEETN